MNLKKVSKYIQSLYDDKSGLYKFSSSSNPTLLSTDFVVMTKYLVGGMNDFSTAPIIESIMRNKGNLNNFIDKKYDVNIERYHKSDYVINQFTFFTLIALDHLGYQFDKLPFFENYLSIDNLKKWFDSLNWGQFWYESNKIMFWMYFYTYIFNYGNDKDKSKAEECINFFFNVLDKIQDKNTGYWGTDYNNNDMVDGCFGSAHIYLFYNYFKREIKYKNKIIDNTLSLHKKNGLVLSNEGGACEDYDAVEIYLRLLKHTDYKKSEIISQLTNMKMIIEKSQERDGGFPYKISPKILGCIKQKKEDTYCYSSWELMETRMFYSDIWGTFFRILTLAAIDQISHAKEERFKTYTLPGWGYV